MLLLALSLISILSSCSTKKNTFTRRAYHNLVSHYNTYWNGRESFREGVRTIERNSADNYTAVLPVFKYGTEQDAMSVASQYGPCHRKIIESDLAALHVF
jgi:hypothetical protein